MKKILFWLVSGLIVVGLVFLIVFTVSRPVRNYQPENVSVTVPTTTSTATSSLRLIAKDTYFCSYNQTITASYYEGDAASIVNPGEPPQPTGHVELVFGNGQTVFLNQTISADGARYANSDESIVFWSKGNGLILTDQQQPAYNNCIMAAPDSGGLAEVYASPAGDFSIRYPQGYKVNSDYSYQELGPGKDIAGVQITINPALTTGTNLAADTYISIEKKPNVKNCTADLFLDPSSLTSRPIVISEKDFSYSVASSTGAGAGNRYEETVYALPGTNPCLAIRYFIHYGVLDNYPAGTVTAFNRAALLAQFDKIRRSLITN